MQTILILGGTGMLGHTCLIRYGKTPNSKCSLRCGTWAASRGAFPTKKKNMSERMWTLRILTRSVAPGLHSAHIVINCIGLIKQTPMASDPLSAITVNSQLPHRISLVCRAANARMIHISTDCVFNGARGNYTEEDPSDATDLYGRSKFLAKSIIRIVLRSGPRSSGMN